MLRKLKLNEIEIASNLAYSLSLNPETNSYQLHNSREEYLKSFNRSLELLDRELLGFFKKDDLIAVIYLDVLKEDFYLQTLGLFIKSEFEKVMFEFLKYIKMKYTGYDIYIGYPKENVKAINYLLTHGFILTESSIDQRLKRDEFKPSDLKNNITKINYNNFDDFAKFHDSKASDLYWISRRLRKHIEDWIIYSYWSGSQLKASIISKKGATWVEIFALLIDDEILYSGVEEDMITATLNEGFKDENIEDVVFFIDSDDECAEKYSRKLGFNIHSHYRCLYTKL